MSEKYRAVTVTVQRLNPLSVMVTVPKMQGTQSIPRSLIHGASDSELVKYQFAYPKEMTIKIMDWKADDLHLA